MVVSICMWAAHRKAWCYLQDIWDEERRRHTYANDVSWLDGTSQDVEHTRLAADAQICLVAVFQRLNLYLISKGLTVHYIKKLVCINSEYAVMWTSNTLSHVTPSHFMCSRSEVTYSTYRVVTLFYTITISACAKNISMGVSAQKWSHFKNPHPSFWSTDFPG